MCVRASLYVCVCVRVCVVVMRFGVCARNRHDAKLKITECWTRPWPWPRTNRVLRCLLAHTHTHVKAKTHTTHSVHIAFAGWRSHTQPPCIESSKIPLLQGESSIGNRLAKHIIFIHINGGSAYVNRMKHSHDDTRLYAHIVPIGESLCVCVCAGERRRFVDPFMRRQKQPLCWAHKKCLENRAHQYTQEWYNHYVRQQY